MVGKAPRPPAAPVGAAQDDPPQGRGIRLDWPGRPPAPS